MNLVQAHMHAASAVAAGPSAALGRAKGFAQTQAMWRFLNNDRVTLEALIQPCREAVGQAVAPFTCRIEGLGHFGSPRAPRVIWAGVSAGSESLTRLQAGIAAVPEPGTITEK